MSLKSNVVYRFGGFRLVLADKQLLREEEVVRLAPKVFDTLKVLVESKGRLVEKEELLKRIWPDSFVEEVALAHSISQLRKALRRGSSEEELIETVPKRGYRFVAPVEVIAEAIAGEPSDVVAVLPFENFRASGERDYLADGLTEEVITALGRLDPDHVRVIGRTSMMSYKRTTKSLAEIGRELGASFLVESSMRAEGARVRINSKLVRASDQVQRWSASYDAEPSSMLEFQRELSSAIAEQVRVRLSPERLNALGRRQTQNTQAYDLYLRGRHCWNQHSPQTTRQAVEYFARATELDPEYALAWSGLADAHTISPITGDADPRHAWAKVRETTDRAMQAGAELAEVQTSLGLMKLWFEWDWPGAESALRKAIALDPGYAVAHRTLGIVLSHMGRAEEAKAAVQRSRELDPLLAMHHALSSQVAFAARDIAAAEQFARQAMVVDPEFWIGYLQLAQAQEQSGEAEKALLTLAKAGKFSGVNSKLVSLRGYIFAKLGRSNEAREVLQTLQAIGRERYMPPYAIALVYAGLGERDAALGWLERAYGVRDVHMVFLTIDPKWDAFRQEPQFSQLLDCCGFTTQPGVSAEYSF